MFRVRALMVVLLVAPALLAGCLDGLDAARSPDAAVAVPIDRVAVAHRLDGATLVPDALAGPGALEGALLPIGAESYEPTLGVDAEGRLFMTGYLSGGAPTIYRSDDDGATWADVGPKLPDGRPEHPFTMDPYLYLDVATGRLFQNDLYVACSFLSWTDDAGASWTTNPAGCGVSTVKDHQSMVTAKPRVLPTFGYDRVVYWCTNTGMSIECATSLDGGVTFGPAINVFPARERPVEGATAGATCDPIHGHPVSDAEGRVYLARGECGVPVVAVTEDDGLTWRASAVSRDVRQDTHILMHDVNLAVDEAGTVYAVWIAEDGLPRYAWSADQARTWSSARIVSPPGVTATALPAIDAGASGAIAIAYIGTMVEGGYGDKPLGGSGTVTDLEPPAEPEAWRDATWNGYITVLTSATADDAVAYTVSANPPSDPIARGVCGKTRCGGMGDFLDVRVGPDGRAWAAFVDVCTGACVTDASVLKEGALGSVGTLVTGPSLRAPGSLAPLSRA
jgi:hypothetical protein